MLRSIVLTSLSNHLSKDLEPHHGSTVNLNIPLNAYLVLESVRSDSKALKTGLLRQLQSFQRWNTSSRLMLHSCSSFHLPAPLALHVDASDYAIGGALHQVVTLSYSHWLSFSRKLTSSEKSLMV
ncbi:hypothetical protein TNCV_2220971 [Trichonephila clavipes]|nr:hypothetical protein TNCV_2220971 [Trichonephila clavipes]